jgi:GntR family transcriptional regulator/MocR family aminotransferase
MGTTHYSLDGQGPRYEQIARAVKGAVLDGKLAPEARLPSTRVLAQALGVARKSVVDAYELLAIEGLIRPRVGVGTVVCFPTRQPQPRAQHLQTPPPTRYAERLRKLPRATLSGRAEGLRYNLQYGAPLANARIFASWTRKVSAAARRLGPGYGPATGHPPLRSAIADYLARRRGLLCEPDDIIIVSGTQQAISLTARLLLNEEDTAVVEDPFYEYAVYALTAHGARLHHVPTDAEGLRVQDIPAGTARLALVTPSHQFPSGVVMSLTRRMELLNWASAANAFILEDDYDSEFHDGRRPPATLRSLDLSGRVIYVGSFSKTLFPSLRLGYVVCPKALRSDFHRAKLLDDLGSPLLEQLALANFMQNGLYEKQLRRTVGEVLARRRTLVRELQRRLGEQIDIGPYAGGMHLVLWFPDMTSSGLNLLVARAAERGVRVQSIAPYYRSPAPFPGLLLGYAGLTASQIRVAIGILADCLREL